MESPLSNVVPILLDSLGNPKGIKKIPMGSVAIAMLDCIESMHKNGYIFVDVKPENFMLSSTSFDSSTRSKPDVGRRVRLIDFGLVERYGDMTLSKHRENAYPNAPLVGTPTYASLNIMSGHTASLRDDVEALGYVISELVLKMASSGSVSRKKDVDILPWSHANTDEELYRIKSQEMDTKTRSTSKLFARLKASGTDAVMSNYFSAVMNLKYSEKPDYNSLRRYLEKLVVTVEKSCGPGEAKKTSTKTAKSPVRKTRAIQMLDDDNSVEVIDENTENRKPSGTTSQKIVAKESTNRRSTRCTKRRMMAPGIGIQSDEIDVIDVDSINDLDAMDWDPVESVTSNGNNQGQAILYLDVVEGPYKGQMIPFGGNCPDTVCVGRDPASRAMKDATKFALSKDKSVSPVHAKFVLNSRLSVHSVRVTNMSSNSDTIINGSSLPSGKSKQVFVGAKMQIGSSLFQIRKA